MTISSFISTVHALQSVSRGLESGPKNVLETLHKKVAELLQDREFEPLWKGLQDVQRRIRDVKIKLLNNERLDLPIEAVGLANLIQRALESQEKLKEIPIKLPLEETIFSVSDISEVRRRILDRPEVVKEINHPWVMLQVSTIRPLSFLKLLIRAGMDVNYINYEYSESLLIQIISCKVCTIKDCLERMTLLLDAGADPNLDSGRYKARLLSSLLYDRDHFNPRAFFLLIDRGLSVSEKDDLDFLREKRDDDFSIQRDKIIVFNGIAIGERIEALARRRGASNQLSRLKQIYERACSQLGFSSVVPKLKGITGMERFPAELLELVNSYHVPTKKEVRTLCYQLDLDFPKRASCMTIRLFISIVYVLQSIFRGLESEPKNVLETLPPD